MIPIHYVLLPPDGDGDPSSKTFDLPAVPRSGDRVMVGWADTPSDSRWFIVDHVRWWPGENRADIVGRWVSEGGDKVGFGISCPDCGWKKVSVSRRHWFSWHCHNCGHEWMAKTKENHPDMRTTVEWG